MGVAGACGTGAGACQVLLDAAPAALLYAGLPPLRAGEPMPPGAGAIGAPQVTQKRAFGVSGAPQLVQNMDPPLVAGISTFPV